MANIAVTDGMDPVAVNNLINAGHNVVEQHYTQEELVSGALADFDAVVVRSATKLSSEVIQKSSNLKFIGRAGVGVDNIDLQAATKSGIVVCNTPQASTNSVVELTIGHLLASCRHIPRGDRGLREGLWEKKLLKGTELSGKRLGLIGFGRIAQGVASVALAMGMECHAYDPYLPSKIAKTFQCTMHDDVDLLFQLCTHISIHCNLTEETHHLVNHERIVMMPTSAPNGVSCGNHIVNCARGGIVDEVAVLNALKSGDLNSAALDVFEVEPALENPLLQHPNFHGTPHIGAATLEAQARIGEEIVTLLKDYFQGKRPHSALN
ncbi:MAG: 3-phosphoglycerate dehydrogenase [Euryarchaeota archaeon]|nr:3-phosphoglycerate dehydrogenase [Euryarchaeota archaeon]